MLSFDLEIFFLLSTLFFTGFVTWLGIKAGKSKQVGVEQNTTPKKSKNTAEIKTEPKISIFEKFDYLGTKIFHNDGKYTVVEDNVSRNFNSLNELPVRYQKMILEMQTKNFQGRKDNYYMESKNGAYTIVFPDGSKKNYKNYTDIPDNIRKILTG
jgi:hypothetical protein